jgi:hypothetical protein
LIQCKKLKCRSLVPIPIPNIVQSYFKQCAPWWSSWCHGLFRSGFQWICFLLFVLLWVAYLNIYIWWNSK